MSSAGISAPVGISKDKSIDVLVPTIGLAMNPDEEEGRDAATAPKSKV